MATNILHTQSGVTVSRHLFGTLPDQRAVEAVTLSTASGIEATIITWGASLQALLLPDAMGARADVVLGHADMAGYLAARDYLGATVGRFANRIAHGRFTFDGKVHLLPRNDGEHTLHGGPDGLDLRLWEIDDVREGSTASVRLMLTSPDRDQGMPGNAELAVTYALDEAGTLTITHEATCDRATPINLTHHGYWNLAGEGAPQGAMDHLLTLSAEHFLPVDTGLIPTGECRAVADTAFDFREARRIGDQVRDAADEQIRIGRGYDHCWAWDETDVDTLRHMASLTDPASGRNLELWSNQPGLQVYSGNFLDGTRTGKSGRSYRQGDAIVLEPQRFPDCVNQGDPGTCRLEPGERYRNIMQFRFGARKPAR